MTKEQTPGVRNKKLLIVALLLAAVVVVVYNIHISRVRSAAEGETVRVMRFLRDMDVGEEIERRDFEPVSIEIGRETADGISAVPAEKWDAVGKRLMRSAQKGEVLVWPHVIGEHRSLPSSKITPGKVAVSLVVDPRRAPGDILHVGDRVNIMGVLSVGNGPLRTYRIAEWLKVLAVGGRGLTEPPGGARYVDRTVRSYRSITVEVSPEVSAQLANVLSHVHGSIWLELRNPRDRAPVRAGKVNSELENLVAASPTVPESGR